MILKRKGETVMKKLVFLGKRGRTTLPLIMRFRHDYHDNDLISFEDNEDGSITIRHECMCEEIDKYMEYFHRRKFLTKIMNLIADL